jgi:hypothetical protein
MQWIILLVALGIGFMVYQVLKPVLGRQAPMERLGRFVNPAVAVAVQARRERVVLRVEDSGRGIAPGD